MKRLLPGRAELLILAAMAMACAALASLHLSPDVALSVGAMPLFVAACLMGMRRNGQLTRRD
jgi:Flp pilus assembly protein TadB